MKKIIYSALFLATLTGCQPANISAVMRGSDRENSSMETRCEETDMRSNSEMQQALKKYDGWRMIYISEYTTGHKIGTHGAICFERPKK